MKRNIARELAFKTIYSRFFNAEQVIDGEIDGEDNVKYVKDILSACTLHKDEINSILSSHIKGYTLERIYKIDLAIITLALVEVKFIESTPKEVAINEAVELAKKYSTDKSPKFVNGVLADILN